MDAKRKEEIEELLKPLKAQSDFAKVMKYNSPVILIFVACFAVAAAGFCQPLFGWVFSEILQELITPIEFRKMALQAEGKPADNWKKDVEEAVVKQVLYIVYMMVVIFVSYMAKSYIFSYLGENVTMKIRQLTYESIL